MIVALLTTKSSVNFGKGKTTGLPRHNCAIVPISGHETFLGRHFVFGNHREQISECGYRYYPELPLDVIAKPLLDLSISSFACWTLSNPIIFLQLNPLSTIQVGLPITDKIDLTELKKLFLHSHHGWEGIGFMWKMTFEIFIKSLRFETPWVRKNAFYESVCLSVCL